MSGTGRIEYRDCYVAFLDILGMKALVYRSEEDYEERNKLAKLLNIFRLERMDEAYDNVRVRAFSDSVIVFTPTTAPAVAVFIAAREIHDRAMEVGCLVRGAIVKGEMYWFEESTEGVTPENDVELESETIWELGKARDVSVTFGPGLTKAYEIEHKKAKYPRIVIDDDLYDHLRSSCRSKPELDHFFHTSGRVGERIPLTDFIRRDRDGLGFLDVLHHRVFRSDIGKVITSKCSDGKVETRYVRLNVGSLEFKKKVREALVQHQVCDTDKKVIEKVRWYVCYYNESLSAEEADLKIVERANAARRCIRRFLRAIRRKWNSRE